MKIKIKKLNENAAIPSYSKMGDAGLDLTAISFKHPSGTDYIEYGTGLAIEIPAGYVGLIFPRSSLSDKPQILTNHVGVIDSNYRGEIRFRFKTINSQFQNQIYVEGDRVGQLIIIPYPTVEFEEVDELSQTNRSTLGFGSSGK